MKKCPFCAEEIQDKAIKCKHCGEWLNNEGQVPSPSVQVSEIEPPESLSEDTVKLGPDDEIKRKEAGQRQCPNCGAWDVYRAIIEDGGYGDWCPHCKKSIPIDNETLSIINKTYNNIKTAWITGAVMAILSILMLISKINVTYFILSVMLIGLTLGIYYKSRISAVIMLSIWALSFIISIYLIINKGIVGGAEYIGSLFLTAFLCYLFYKGVKGTFAYHSGRQQYGEADRPLEKQD